MVNGTIVARKAPGVADSLPGLSIIGSWALGLNFAGKGGLQAPRLHRCTILNGAPVGLAA